MDRTNFWKTKLAARIHDPAEKALVLLRDPAGHEGGTSKALTRLLGLDKIRSDTVTADGDNALSAVLFKKGLPRELYRHVQRADWWAAAADRPQWPIEEITVTTQTGETRTRKIADWAQVRWTKRPVLIHPLSGESCELPGSLSDTDIVDIKKRSLTHFSDLVAKLGGPPGDCDTQGFRKLFLTWWRFGPDLDDEHDFGRLGELWRLLPADTRIPDHSIWDHLDVTSAFAGAFAADHDNEAALLALSIGPVQSFIAAARSTSDLWAGSHLLSRLAWEAMKPVCEALGPDAVLFPRLRAVPQVDLWLRDECGLPAELFSRCEWVRGRTDSNPLFSAALPNRFVAIVPRKDAEALARGIEARLRKWLLDIGYDVVDRLLEEAGLRQKEQPRDETIHAYAQVREQLAGFPEVHWAIIPFSLIRPRNVERQTDLDVAALSDAMAPYFESGNNESPGFLATPAWQLLQKEIALQSEHGRTMTFFSPNPGVLYPAIHDLSERVLAAAKSVRPFVQCEQEGWRCSLTGETEWLTADAEQLNRSYRQQTDTLWIRLSERKPAWAKKGEHLGALSAVKRLWPTLFSEEARKALGSSRVDRFVVSTHTMAIAANLEALDSALASSDDRRALAEITVNDEPPPLPPRLARLRDSVAARVIGAMERLSDSENPDDERKLSSLQARVASHLGHKAETYYALLFMDGDHMGRIFSGIGPTAIPYLESFHPQVRKGFTDHARDHELVRQYGAQVRAISPNRHLAISAALNDFSLIVARHVVEREHRGKVIYAGGDDVLAMLPACDLMSAMQRLRYAYSGHDPEPRESGQEGGQRCELRLDKGFAFLNGRLMRMMGKHASASCGAVIAHYQAPLTAVLRELRSAEARAKNEGGRDAFALTVVKRSGGALFLTAKWGSPIRLLHDLREFLSDDDVSRGAIYHILEWLKDLPPPHGDAEMLSKLIEFQLDRQSGSGATKRHSVQELAQRLAAYATATARAHVTRPPRSEPDGPVWSRELANFLSVAEFLAREMRDGEDA